MRRTHFLVANGKVVFASTNLQSVVKEGGYIPEGVGVRYVHCNSHGTKYEEMMRRLRRDRQ